MNETSEPWKWGEQPPVPKPEPINPQGERHLCCGYDGYMQAFASGDWVRYKDYEALKAEVERLRKAGDAMERSLAFAYPDSPKIKEWNAAKEGKQS